MSGDTETSRTLNVSSDASKDRSSTEVHLVDGLQSDLVSSFGSAGESSVLSSLQKSDSPTSQPETKADKNVTENSTTKEKGETGTGSNTLDDNDTKEIIPQKLVKGVVEDKETLKDVENKETTKDVKNKEPLKDVVEDKETPKDVENKEPLKDVVEDKEKLEDAVDGDKETPKDVVEDKETPKADVEDKETLKDIVEDKKTPKDLAENKETPKDVEDKETLQDTAKDKEISQDVAENKETSEEALNNEAIPTSPKSEIDEALEAEGFDTVIKKTKEDLDHDSDKEVEPHEKETQQETKKTEEAPASKNKSDVNFDDEFGMTEQEALAFLKEEEEAKKAAAGSGPPNIQVYGSSVSGNMRIKKAQNKMLDTLDRFNIAYEFVDLAADGDAKLYIKRKNPNSTAIPQLYIDGEFKMEIDEFDELLEYDELFEALGVDPDF